MCYSLPCILALSPEESNLILASSFPRLRAISVYSAPLRWIALFPWLPQTFNLQSKIPTRSGPLTFNLPPAPSPLAATLMHLPVSVADKRLTRRAKLFRCNTYKKRGGRVCTPILGPKLSLRDRIGTNSRPRRGELSTREDLNDSPGGVFTAYAERLEGNRTRLQNCTTG